ncbi:hypothetical protein CASFOL_004886 [Castilleja foliolosa]|uniref:Agamous-like MADS-box protein AGL15 n=1 Tax=Castilleja foliolosa TaxID=1961234 RepID=A0ABD3ECF7_9LAMI
MGRGKIEIKKIENANSRQVTFSKRRMGLCKKAKELAILCDADVAVIVFSNTGKLFEFSSSSMKKILTRYKKRLDGEQVPIEETKPEKEQPNETDVLKEEIEKLKLRQLRLLGKDLTGMGLPDLHALERQLNEGLWCIKEQKEKVLMQQLEQCRTQEQRAVLENETLCRQVEELQTFFPSTSSQTPLCLERDSRSPEMANRDGLGDEDSDTTLHLASKRYLSEKKGVKVKSIQAPLRFKFALSDPD